MGDIVRRVVGVPVLSEEEWGEAIAPVRKELSFTYLGKAKRALEAGLYDAAVNYVWDLVINDLRLKVEAYGVEIFLSVEDGLKYQGSGETLQDRWRDIVDYRLLSGCHKLNLISRTAFRHLSFWLSVRNHESAAHPVDEEEEIDLSTAMSLVRDGARFVFSRERPPAGFNLKTMADNLKSRDLTDEVEEIREQIKQMNQGQCDSALGMMISLFVGGTPQTKKNIQLLISGVWNKTSDQAKRKVGEKYAKLSAEGEADAKAEVFSILTNVDGVGLIPESLRGAMFRKAAKDLIAAHFGWSNFEKEVAPARQLAELGVDCPDDALATFSTAFLVSYMGNFYGLSNASQPYLRSLKERFSSRHWKAVMEAIRSSSEVQSELSSPKPFTRVQQLCAEILPALVSAKDKRDCEFILKNTCEKVLSRFAGDDE
ncbi:MAG: hypothetical protein ABFD90_19250 [Phycisphaerales bacterium]